jgi:hypothetical protein
VVVVPAALIAAWGFFYLSTCFQILTAPGRPIEFRYESKAGPLTLRVASFVYSPESGALRANGLTLHDPTGKLLAKAGVVTAGGLEIWSLGKKAIDVSAREGYALLELLPNGRPRFLEFLPEPSEQPSEIPYRVDLHETVIDIVSPDGKLGSAAVPEARVEGVGDRWVAGAPLVRLKGSGSFAARAWQSRSEGLDLQVETKNLDLTTALEYLRKTDRGKEIEGIQDLKVASLILDGTAALRLPPKRPAELQVDGLLRANDVLVKGKYGADQASFQGVGTEHGLRGVLIARQGATSAQFSGALTWENRTRIAGQMLASAPSQAALPAWMRALLPKDLRFSGGSFSGWLSYDPQQQVRADGRVLATTLAAQGEMLTGASANVHVDSRTVLADIGRAQWMGVPVSGFVRYSPKTREMQAAVVGKGVPLTRLAGRFGVKDITGNADVAAHITGTLDHPAIAFNARGAGSILIDKRKIAVQDLTAWGAYENGLIVLPRVSIHSRYGSLAASGSVDPKRKSLDLAVLSSGVPLDQIHGDVSGRLAADARIRGTFQRPIVEGRVEAYDVRFQDYAAPLLVADLRSQGERVQAKLEGVVNSAPANALLTYDVKSGALSGHADARVFLSDFLANAAGVANVQITGIQGTLDNPRAVASITSNRAFVQGAEIQNLFARGDITKQRISIEDLSASVGRGRITGAGEYLIAQKSGSITGSAIGLPIEQFSVQAQEFASLQGLVDAPEFSVTLGPQGLAGLSASGQIRRLQINNVLFDGGPWSIRGDGRTWTGNAMLGVLERYIQVPSFTYDSVNETLDAQLEVLNLSIDPLIQASLPYLKEPSPGQPIKPLAHLEPEAIQRLQSLDGLVSAAISVSGPLKDLSVSEGLVDLNALTYRGENLGDITSSFTRQSDTWDVRRFLWNGPGRLEASGTIQEHGKVDLNAELRNLDLNRLSLIDPGLASLHGTADLSAVVFGPTNHPDAKGSVDVKVMESPDAAARRVAAQTGETPTGPVQAEQILSVSLPFTVAGDPDKIDSYLLDAAGSITYRVFTGDISATIPLLNLARIDPTREWQAAVVASERDLTRDDLNTYLPAFDPDRTNLRASGQIRAQGKGSDYDLTGLIAVGKSSTAGAGDPAVALRDYQTTLQEFSGSALLNGSMGRASIQATGSNGGTVNGVVSADLGNVESVLSSLVSGSTGALLKIPISGSLTTLDFGVKERQLIKQENGGEPGTVNTTLNGTVLFGETVGAPSIKTLPENPILLSGSEFTLPTLATPPATAFAPRIVPSFDVQVQFADPARIRAGNATLSVTGGGSLGGDLMLPEVQARLEVESGLLRLPTARVRIQEGGSLLLTYRAQPGEIQPVARLDVDLMGQTNVTALRFGSLIERYNVDLRIRGNLLAEEPINITATSDPPDLSTSQILRLIGQADLLEGLTASVRTSLGDPKLQQAFTTLAVPAIFDPFTEKLATQLGLDYLNIEYNTLEQATITAAKTLGRGLVLQFRRQLFEPPAGQKPRFDLRLVYRLPSRNPLLGRVTASIGIDQDRPWKIALEYATRF